MRLTQCLSIGLMLVFLAPLAPAQSFDHQHSLWTQMLKKYVVQKRRGATAVRYQDWKANPDQLEQYLNQLSEVSKDRYQGWNQNQKLAFLINAYNAWTIQLILNHYPVDSIKDTAGWFGSPWEKELVKLFDKKWTLDTIEHGFMRGKYGDYNVPKKLRTDFNEPRIHFAVNCASIGCPALRRKAYTAKELDEQLKKAAKAFLQDEQRNRYHPDTKTLYLSALLVEWYGGDFKEKYGSYHAFVAPFMTDSKKHEKLIRKQKVEIKNTGYDWGLNDASDSS